MEEIVNLLVNNSVAIAVVAFYMYKDIKFMDTLQKTLITLVDTVNNLKDIVDKQEKEKE